MECHFSSIAKNNEKNQQKQLGVVDLNQINLLIMKSATKKCHPFHDLPQICGGSKYVCPVWIWPTETFNYTEGKVSGLINSDPVNQIYTSEK